MDTNLPADFGACLWCARDVEAHENWLVADYPSRKRVHSACAEAWEHAGKSLLEVPGGQAAHVVVAARTMKR